MRFKKEKSAGYLANHMARLFALRLAERIKPLGIVPGQFPVLLALWEEDGQTQKQLVGELSVEQATMANTLSRMERDGLITRKADPSDLRTKRIFLTSKAIGIQEPAIKAANAINAQAMHGLSEEQADLFLAAMGRIIANLSREQG